MSSSNHYGPYSAIHGTLTKMIYSEFDCNQLFQNFKENGVTDEVLVEDEKSGGTLLDNYIKKAGQRIKFRDLFKQELKLKQPISVSTHDNHPITNCKIDQDKSITRDLSQINKKSIAEDMENLNFSEVKEVFNPDLLHATNANEIKNQNYEATYSENYSELGVDMTLVEHLAAEYKINLKSQIQRFKETENLNYLINDHLHQSHSFAVKALDLENKISSNQTELKAKILSRIKELFKLEESENTSLEVKAVNKAQILMETHLEYFKENFSSLNHDNFKNVKDLKGHLSLNLTNAISDFELIVSLDKTHKEQMIETFKDLLAKETCEIEKEFVSIGIFNANIATTLESAITMYKRNMDETFKKRKHLDPKELIGIHEMFCQKVFILLEEELSQFNDEEEMAKEKILRALKEIYDFYYDQNMANKPNPNAWIGIDLGTTYSSVAIYTDGDYVNIPVEMKCSIPSTVAYNDKDDKTQAIVGSIAADNAYKNPKTTFYDAKRLMGKKMKDDSVQIDKKFWPFDIATESGSKNEPVRFVAEYSENKKILISPEEISAQILLKLLIPAIKYLNEQLRNLCGAVIGIPAGSSSQFKEATLAAVSLAIDYLIDNNFIKKFDIANVKFISEPVAVAYAYRPFIELGKNILILDIGGGTLDISIMKIAREVQVVCTSGNAHLGGQDIDNYIYTYVRNKYKEMHGIDIEMQNSWETSIDISQRRSRLKGEIEKIKRDLSGEECPEAIKLEILNFFFNSDSPHFQFMLRRTDFEKAIEKFYEDMRYEIIRAIECSKIQYKDIDEVVLVGGTTNLPKIRDGVKELFGEKKLHDKVDKNLAVCFGAAFEAARVNGEIDHLQSDHIMQIQEVLPMSVGIDVQRTDTDIMYFDRIIYKGTKIPTEATQNYFTAKPGQKSVQWTIREGENENEPEKNNIIGEFVLEGIPPNGNKRQDLTCKMIIDDKLQLVVTATCVCNGKQEEIKIDVDRGGISKKDYDNAKERIRLQGIGKSEK